MRLASIGSRKVLASVVSALAAVAILAIAAWMLLANQNGGLPPADADVRIIPPGAESPAPAAPSAVPVSPAPPSPVRPSPALDLGGADPFPTPTDPAVVEDASGAPDIAVYITGAVANPGVYTVRPGQRLANVVALAGGATQDADLNQVNLAAYVSDAVHYRIPTVGETTANAEDSVVVVATAVPMAPAGSASADREVERPTASPASVCAVPLNINTATAECLETLPGIGSVRAQSIVAHRDLMGPFATTDGITEVSGIGDGIYSRIANLIVVGNQ